MASGSECRERRHTSEARQVACGRVRMFLECFLVFLDDLKRRLPQFWEDAAHGQGNSLRQLVQAEQDVAEGKAFIAKQQRLIVESERDDCRDVAETMRLLEAFLVLQRSREEDRARILDELQRT